ncbi:MAG TPA: hypothetical protein VEX39_18840 [Thermoleophilaceae bacterium]|nr:hypothetical protein [Thermoleophilaceae bacterium]
MRRGWLIVVGLALVAVFPTTAQGAETRYSLANGCFAVRSADTGTYVSRDGPTRSMAKAEPFRMKAATLGKYLLYGTKGDYLSPRGERTSFSRKPSIWTVDASVRSQDGRFSFVRTGVCARFPEATAGAKGPAFKGATRLGEVSGTLDAHGHLTAYEFIGGKFHCGKPFSRLGIADALPDCSRDRGPGGTGAPLQNLLDFGSPVAGKDQVGYPTFKDWPSTHALTYEGTYWKWVERSWRSGLRMMVTLLVDNDVLCNLQTNRVNSCDEMQGAKLQRKRLYELQDYIDAQYGGPGKGFLRIVTDPFQARKVVADGKLAVVMGMETSALFGCRGSDQAPECNQAKVDRGLAEFRKLGVRSFFPVHKFDNPLGGTKMDGGTTGLVVNPGNKLAFGRFWDARTCKGPETDNTQATNGGALAGALANSVAGTPLAGALSGQTPVYPPGPHCNPRGLTRLGRHLIDKLMESKSIVEIDHMSAVTRNQTLDILEKRKYSGVISAHTWASPLNYPRIYKLGGIVTPAAGSQDAAGFVKEWSAYRKLRSKRFYFGFGFGSDTNGLAVQGSPPKKPLSYPFTALDGKTKMGRQVTGKRTFDYNTEGVAHYGLYADWLADLRRTGGQQMAREMNRGAEAYLQMWERAEGVKQTTCRNATAEVTSRRLLGRVPLGAHAYDLLRRAGQPTARPGAFYRWCVKRSKGAVTAAFNSRSRAVLVISTAKRHRSGRVRVGSRSRALRGRAKKLSTGVYVGRRLKGGARRVYLVRKRRVVAVGLGARSLVKSRKTLAGALRGAMKGPVSTLDPPGASAVSGAPAAAIAQARAAERSAVAQPRYALCTIGANPN